MKEVPEAVLHECLDFLEQGETIEQILVRYPELAAGLRPFLETASQLTNLAPQPSLAAKQKSQKAFLAHAESLKVTPIRPSPWYRLRRALLPFVSLALVLILFAITAVSVSTSAIPGDALYSVKRLVETVRLNQTNDPLTAATLMEQYRQERVREVQTLLRTGRTAEVTFDGKIEAIQTESWTVASINVLLNAETMVVGQPKLDETARVNGRTADGKLTASSIQVLTAFAPTLEPTDMPEPTETPEATPSPTVTLTATSTVEPSMTPTVEPSATATIKPTMLPTITMTPSPQPTATLPPSPTTPPNNNDDNENDDDDNHNDNNDNDNDNNENGNDNNENGNDNNENDNDNNDNDNDNNDNDDDDDNHNDHKDDD